MAQKITPNLWFDTEAEEAARFYTSVFEDSRIVEVSHYPENSPGPAGSVMTVEWELNGQRFVGGLVGARLNFLLDNWDDVSDDLLGNLFSGSGLVWYGGAIGGAIGVLLWARWRGMLNLTLLDVCAPALALGYAIGRIGCQLAGDGDYGQPWDGPWAMAYPDGTVPTTEEVHPTPIYEALAMGAVAYLLWRLRAAFRPGVLFALYLVLAGAERFLVEFVRRNEDVALGLTQAQLLSVAMILAGVAWLVGARRGGLRSSAAGPHRLESRSP